MSARDGAGDGLRGTAAALLGVALGATIAAGNALLLYTGQGFLRAAGLLFASSIMAIAAGVWAGDGADPAPRSRGRWFGTAIALLAGGGFSMVWSLNADARSLALGGALAVLLILAVPGYAAGSVLVALHRRQQAVGAGGIAAAALAGAAFGVLLSTSILIQNLEPYAIYYAGAAIVSTTGLIESRTRIHGGAGNMDVRNFVVLITGIGDRGQLGWTLVRRFLDAGARVVATGRGEGVEALEAELGAADDMLAIRADLTVEDDVARLVAGVHERFGRLDALINAAGGLSVMASIEETTPEQWQAEIRRNAETALRTTRAVLPLLRESGGAVVNFAAPAGERAAARLGAYSAGKAAVIALTRALALEEKRHGVRVNAIAPGTMDTEQNREAMPGREAKFVSRDDVASVALFLASPAAAGVTGEVIHVMGPGLE